MSYSEEDSLKGKERMNDKFVANSGSLLRTTSRDQHELKGMLGHFNDAVKERSGR